MSLSGILYQIVLMPSVEPRIWLFVISLGLFGLIVVGCITQYCEREDMLEGTWYCSELRMQISFTDPNNSFLTENEVRIRCRCNAVVIKYHYVMVELYCQEWDHPRYKHGKTLFAGTIETFGEMSMVVHSSKANRKYTFMRTDKTG